jgi:hypothetical protein
MTLCLWITPKFCSGNSVIVLVTEQDFAFKIKDLAACSGVLVFLGGMGRNVRFSQIVRAARQVQEKRFAGAIYLFSSGTEQTNYIYF